ncbi:molybdopterin dinucleotide binding domain-containing protein, partial [Luedemannella flava]|uniref:molybdopterin dinucleotide binding domain-containing protein n=1 Tax=Luedemannella flava TaxID=349316 RepID=UPI0031DCDF03
NLLPGGRPVSAPAARAEIAGRWGLEAGVISGSVGRDTDQIIEAAAAGRLGALVVAGVDPADLADPTLAEQALDKVGFLVSFELRNSAVSRRADVVFPVAPVQEKAGTFLNWEGRLRSFDAVFDTTAMSDARVLDALAAAMGVTLGTADVAAVRAELGALPVSGADKPAAPRVAPRDVEVTGPGEAVLATWHQLLDLGSLLDGDEVLGGTARPAVVRLSKDRAASLGVADGDPVRVSTDKGSITLPVELTDMPDAVVWVPTNSPGATVRRSLGVTSGDVVTISRGGIK